MLKLTNFILFLIFTFLIYRIYPIIIDRILPLLGNYKKLNLSRFLVSFVLFIASLGISVLWIITVGNQSLLIYPAFLSFAFVLSGFAWTILLFQPAWDDIQPPSKIKKGQKRISKILTIVFIVLFFGGLVILFFEGDQIENTINGWNLALYSFLFGLFLATGIVIITHKFMPYLYIESGGRVNMFLGIFMCIPVLFPSLTSFVNRHIGTESISREYEVIEKYTNNTSAGNYIVLNAGNGKERIVVDRSFWAGIQPNNHVILKLRKGILDYYYVLNYEIKQ
jgi:hypothetical protein